jgi:hypothetical protein
MDDLVVLGGKRPNGEAGLAKLKMVAEKIRPSADQGATAACAIPLNAFVNPSTAGQLAAPCRLAK